MSLNLFLCKNLLSLDEYCATLAAFLYNAQCLMDVDVIGGGMNALLLPVSWEMVEPAEGTFDFSVPKALICSPFSVDGDRNTENAQLYSCLAAEQGFIPLDPHLLLPQFISKEMERESAIRIGLYPLPSNKHVPMLSQA